MAGEVTEVVEWWRGPEHVARGCRKHGASKAMLKVVILLDEETFEEVSGGAIASTCSFAAQARMLIEVGLETLKLDEAA